MTKKRLHELLVKGDGVSAEKRLSEIGDALVMTTIVDNDAFWAAPRVEQLLYAFCSVLHHAGANGLEALWSYNECSSASTLAAAIEGLEEIGEHRFAKIASDYWRIIADHVASKGERIPSKFSEGTREQYERIEEVANNDYEDLFERNESQLYELSLKFVSCWNTTFPDSVMKWLAPHERELAGRICR